MSEIGVQAIAIAQPVPLIGAFDNWWSRHGEWVEQPNRRRGGESGVQRLHEDGRLLYAKRQVGHLYRSLRHPFGRPTVLRESDALRSLDALGVRVPQVVHCSTSHCPKDGWRALLVTEALDGFEDLDAWYASAARDRYDERLHQQMLHQLAATLARMHRARWQHGCLYAKHVFIRVSGEGADARAEVALLDLEKSRRRFSARRAALHDLQQLKRHSSFSASDWEKLIYVYRAAFGSSIKGL